jgi:hypothetical protein
MNGVRAWGVVLACAAVATSGTLHAQTRTPTSKEPQGKPRIERNNETSPCFYGLFGRTPGKPSCYLDERSLAIALAWEKGLDERGVALDAAARAKKFAEMEAWLRRLAGTFRIDGTYRNHGGTTQVLGSAKCSSVGDGAGVSCAITAKWQSPKENFKEPEFDKALYNAMQPLIVHLGINPDTFKIRATLMESRALKMYGFLIGDEVAFGGESLHEYDPSKPLVPNIWAGSLISIRPDDVIGMRFAVVPTSIPYQLRGSGMLNGQIILNRGIEFNLQLHREPPGTPDSKRASP